MIRGNDGFLAKVDGKVRRNRTIRKSCAFKSDDIRFRNVHYERNDQGSSNEMRSLFSG